MATRTASEELRKGDRVVAAVDLRGGVPAGTTGRVSMVSGLTWIRYWVRFDNGVAIGSINRSKLATPEEWERGPVEDAPAAGAAASGDGDGAAAPVVAAGEDVVVNGVTVPALLIERAKAARARLGG